MTFIQTLKQASRVIVRFESEHGPVSININKKEAKILYQDHEIGPPKQDGRHSWDFTNDILYLHFEC